jgi:hypothetical protein
VLSPVSPVSFFATFALVFVLIFRPQEIWPFLEDFRLLDVLTGLAAIGVAWDFATEKAKNAYSPQLPFLGAFVASSYFSSLLLLGREGLGLATTRSAIATAAMLVVMYGTRSLVRLRALMALLVVLAVFVAGVAVHQAQVEPVCIELPISAGESIDSDPGTSDGRNCTTKHDCAENGKTEIDYVCERIGLFKTVSIQRRVRWRGQLGDPNELSVYLGIVIPLLFAISAGLKNKWATGGAFAMLALILYAIILTQSRGGQLVVGAVFGIYFFSRFRWKGLLAAATLALPVVLLGGREGIAADSSTDERLELLYDAVTEFMHRPFFGVGIDQFYEIRRMTAHNSYLLVAVELGLPGMFAWTGLCWMSVKIPLAVVRNAPAGLRPDVRRLAMALIVSWVGMAIGIFFLSFTYKQLLFVWLGMSGALYGVVKADHPDFEVRIERKDLLGIAIFDLVLLALLFAYTRLKPM